MVWDLFCRVIDNFGDIGVCWRLAAGLAQRGLAVRLWTDDASALAWMAPQGAPGVLVIAWTDAAPDLAPGAVVIEAFGCSPPDRFVARMALQSPAPLWINLEYLSAEPYVERSHGLRSPQFSGPGRGLDKWFFYPGFTVSTGGLLRSGAALTGDRAAALAWVAAQGWGALAGELAITVFCYPNPALPALRQLLAGQPLLLRVPPGAALAQLQALALPAAVRLLPLPHLSQPDFDQLLAAADFNLVRGEDSFVRAQTSSGAPFLWQIYPQADGAHAAKLGCFLDLYLADWPAAELATAAAVRAAFMAFNSLAPSPAALPDRRTWAAQHARWQQRLAQQADLCTQLMDFAKARTA